MRKLVIAAVLVAVAACAPKAEKAPEGAAMDSAAMMNTTTPTDTARAMGDSAMQPADTTMARDTSKM